MTFIHTTTEEILRSIAHTILYATEGNQGFLTVNAWKTLTLYKYGESLRFRFSFEFLFQTEKLKLNPAIGGKKKKKHPRVKVTTRRSHCTVKLRPLLRLDSWLGTRHITRLTLGPEKEAIQ